MRFHILGLAHTVTSPDYCSCAYTIKVLRLCKMLKDRGHHVIHYGHERSQVECGEHVTVTRDKDLMAAYGGYDWKKEFFKFSVEDVCYREFFGNAIGEIWKRKQPKDFLLCMWGAGHRPVADMYKDMIVVEPGIGYAGGHFAPYKVFESYALLHAYGGLKAVDQGGHLGNYDVVIPNYFDVADFDYSEKKEGYFLCLGRIGTGKGVQIAIHACKEIGARLVIAGQGGPSDLGIKELPDHVDYVGFADVEKRRKLLAGARGAFVLSAYTEPFGGVMIEAALSGTPVITTDWGAATENVLHGITGFRCRTFEHITWAARNIDRISPRACRDWAVANFSTDRVAAMYEEFFRMVMDIHGGAGWYEPRPGRADLDWLVRSYPVGQRDAAPAPAAAPKKARKRKVAAQEAE
jgi:glycosyltransferase involved in cell wall biosynthesis